MNVSDDAALRPFTVSTSQVIKFVFVQGRNLTDRLDALLAPQSIGNPSWHVCKSNLGCPLLA